MKINKWLKITGKESSIGFAIYKPISSEIGAIFDDFLNGRRNFAYLSTAKKTGKGRIFARGFEIFVLIRPSQARRPNRRCTVP